LLISAGLWFCEHAVIASARIAMRAFLVKLEPRDTKQLLPGADPRSGGEAIPQEPDYKVNYGMQ